MPIFWPCCNRTRDALQDEERQRQQERLVSGEVQRKIIVHEVHHEPPQYLDQNTSRGSFSSFLRGGGSMPSNSSSGGNGTKYEKVTYVTTTQQFHAPPVTPTHAGGVVMRHNQLHNNKNDHVVMCGGGPDHFYDNNMNDHYHNLPNAPPMHDHEIVGVNNDHSTTPAPVYHLDSPRMKNMVNYFWLGIDVSGSVRHSPALAERVRSICDKVCHNCTGAGSVLRNGGELVELWRFVEREIYKTRASEAVYDTLNRMLNLLEDLATLKNRTNEGIMTVWGVLESVWPVQPMSPPIQTSTKVEFFMKVLQTNWNATSVAQVVDVVNLIYGGVAKEYNNKTNIRSEGFFHRLMCEKKQALLLHFLSLRNVTNFSTLVTLINSPDANKLPGETCEQLGNRLCHCFAELNGVYNEKLR